MDNSVDATPIRVLLVDSYQLLRKGLAHLINEEPGIQVVGEADSVEQALDMLQLLPVDVLLIHYKFAGMATLEQTQRLLRAKPDIRIIVMLPVTLGVLPSRMLRAGASAYISPCVTVNEMLWAIHLVHSGQRYISPRITEQLERDPFEQNIQSPFDTLSKRELQVALMLVDSYRVNAISDQLCVSPKTIYSYRYRIFDKLGLNSDVELARLAVKHGLGDAQNIDSGT